MKEGVASKDMLGSFLGRDLTYFSSSDLGVNECFKLDFGFFLVFMYANLALLYLPLLLGPKK